LVWAGGDNATPNGLALCYLHHEAYDRALIGIQPDYRIQVSEAAVRRLQRLARTNRLEHFRKNLRRELLLPQRNQDYPLAERLAQGLTLRGWG